MNQREMTAIFLEGLPNQQFELRSFNLRLRT